MDKELRMRFVPSGMKVRESGSEEGPKVIEGCAIVFEKETTLWDSKYYQVKEVIAKDCITADFLREQDIKLNLLHDRDMSLARSKKGEGTLDLDLREDGLYFSFPVPDCDLGKRALALIENGTYTGCSFEFYPGEYDDQLTMEGDKECHYIRHKSMKAVTALTIAMDPAYEQTSVGEREKWEARESELEGEAAKAAKAAEEAAEKAKAEEAAREEQEARMRKVAAMKAQL